jgi:hypothetical protein
MMLADLDGICQQAGIFPDIFFSGHAHSYQRYTRFVGSKAQPQQIPYLVVGCGGHGDQTVQVATGQLTGDARFDSSYRGYGYALVSVAAKIIKVSFYGVGQGVRTLIDGFALDFTKGVVSKL